MELGCLKDIPSVKHDLMLESLQMGQVMKLARL